MKLHAIAVDDEPIALEIIKQHGEKIAFIDIRKYFLSQTEALIYIQKYQPDLIFLDIQMPDGSGLDFAKNNNISSQIIYTTAFSDYAIQAFDMVTTDYLLKPIGFDRFERACKRAIENHHSAKNVDYLFVKSGTDHVRINLQELNYIKSADNYAVFYEKHRQTISRITLSEVLELLPPYFCRIHKSYIISLNKIEEVSTSKLKISGVELPISARFKKSFSLKWNR